MTDVRMSLIGPRLLSGKRAHRQHDRHQRRGNRERAMIATHLSLQTVGDIKPNRPCAIFTGYQGMTNKEISR